MANGSGAMPKYRDVARARSKSRSKCDPADNCCDVCSSYARAFDTSVQCGCPVKLVRKPRVNTCRCECDAPATSQFNTCPLGCAAAAPSRSRASESRRRSVLGSTQSSNSSSSREETPSAKLTRVSSYPSSYPSQKDGFYTLEKDGFYTPENNGEDVSGKENDKSEEDGGHAAGSRYLLEDEGRYPVDKTTGRYPVDKTTGRYPADKKTGRYLADKTTARYPADDTTGRYPNGDKTGRYPADDTTGSYPADKTTGRYLADDTTGRYPSDTAERSRHQEDIHRVSASVEPPLRDPDGNSARMQFYQSIGKCYAQLKKVDAPCSELCRC